MEIVNKITSEMLPKYFRPEASTFEIKMGIFIVDDLIEFLGQDLLKHIWTDLAKIVIGFNTHSSMEIRRAASYGIGIFAKFTKYDFNLYVNDCIVALNAGLNFVKKENDDDTEFGGAKDNATSSLGKIIKYQTAFIDVGAFISKWLEHLPIVHDLAECEEQHLMLIQIINNQNSLVVGENYVNLPKIIKIFGKIYKTKKYSSVEIDTGIQSIMTSMISNEVTNAILLKTRDGLAEKDKLRKKLDSFINKEF